MRISFSFYPKISTWISIILLISFLVQSCKKDPAFYSQQEICNITQPKHDTVVLLVLGQSNAANAGSERYTASCNQAQNFYEGKLYPLADPLRGSNGDGGSVWSRLGQQLIENNFAAHVIVAPATVGGTRIEQWIPGGDLNYLIIAAIADLKAKNLKVTHVLWHQGESNNFAYYPPITATQNAQSYRQNFLLLVQQIRALGIDALIFPAMTSRCGQTPSDTVLIEVQRNLADASLGIYNGPNTDILGNEFRYDACHFNGLGLSTHALLWRAALASH